MSACGCARTRVCTFADARAGARTCVRACEGAHVPVCVSECVGAHTSALEGARSHTCDRACGCAYVPALRADLSRHGAHPPKLNGCGKLQIFIPSVKQLEPSSTPDFAQHISA